MPTIGLYLDAAGTTPATLPLAFKQDKLGLDAPHQREFFAICMDGPAEFRAASNPGVDSIVLSITDADAGGGQPVSAIKLAFTQGGLAGAVGGDPLDFGPLFLDGPANAVGFWAEFDDSTGVLATDLNISIGFNALEISIP